MSRKLRHFINSSNGRFCLLAGFGFALSELWIYHWAFANRFEESLLRLWEGPLSAVLLLVCVGFLLRYWSGQWGFKRAAFLCLGLFSLLLYPALFPITPPPTNEWRIEVYKGERKMKVYHRDHLKHEFPIGLGNPEGDKVVMSDSKTPLGEFSINDKGPSHFHKWLGLSYPNLEDAARGRRSGLITWVEYYYIRCENLNGKMPYGNSSLGGAVGIHGGGSDNDWTMGCVALSNEDIDKIYDDIELGTRVLIYP